ncbi:MAG TPA: sugar transferase [Candidatus Eubacterium faecavium]|nr:sugar transferase [Candidatus Eubacterium faecavium]
MYKQFKRFCDFTVSLVALIVLSPLFAVVAIAIKLDSKGPVIFKQERLGFGGNVFLIYKFRSMCVGAEQTGTGQYSFEGDPRVTKVGRFLRATSIDELPQLLNVLKGEMSIVGFRPPLTYHPWPIEEYTKYQKRMFLVKPGITGWAQVNGRKEVEWHERIRLNVYYVENMSLLLDIRIVFMTFINVLKNKDNMSSKATVDCETADEEVRN